ncbi:hypothetical protein [Brachybacterium sp. J153]|uniref:hypothetical protein n=1 Tax=Brachybacterium sp. J153 TaxID=3116488 RepID=UPI002E788BE7|nr:hypothetical protein [Brachybacterium sp. J153]MEE1619016.1 hypothetical protein [Brachybacterium sp. J153]
MTSPSAPVDAAPPVPRRTRGGAVLVGPSIRSRYLPLALWGLPLLAAVLSPFGGVAIQQLRRSRLAAGHDGVLEAALDPAGVQLLLGGLLLWAMFALWALVPVLLTHRLVLLDEAAGTLVLRRGLRTSGRAALADVVHAVGEPERGSLAVIGVRSAGGVARGGGDGDVTDWIIPEIGWDEASFDGLRALQAAAGLRPAPPRRELLAARRQDRRARAHQELAERLGMPWRPEYTHDEAAFQAEFDRVRRVLGGKEEPREGDPTP